jgi:hypothetical protein
VGQIDTQTFSCYKYVWPVSWCLCRVVSQTVFTVEGVASPWGEIYTVKEYPGPTRSEWHSKHRIPLGQWSSTWGTRAHGVRDNILYQNETHDPLEPWTSSDPRTDEDSSPNLGAGILETSSFISLSSQNHINNW